MDPFAKLPRNLPLCTLATVISVFISVTTSNVWRFIPFYRCIFFLYLKITLSTARANAWDVLPTCHDKLYRRVGSHCITYLVDQSVAMESISYDLCLITQFFLSWPLISPVETFLLKVSWKLFLLIWSSLITQFFLSRPLISPVETFLLKAKNAWFLDNFFFGSGLVWSLSFSFLDLYFLQ